MDEPFTFTSFKYPHSPHRRWSARGVAHDGAQFLFWRREIEMVYPSTGCRRFFREPALEFVFVDRGYKMALWFDEQGAFGGLYADVCLPPRVDLETHRVDFLDLDLDVQILGVDAVAQVLDREEFAQNRRALRYPATLSSFAEGALDRLLRDISLRRHPLDRPYEAWWNVLAERLAGDGRSGENGGESYRQSNNDGPSQDKRSGQGGKR